MFILLHSINIGVVMVAMWVYLHPFDTARPSMQWIYVAHAIAFISLVLMVVQVFLFPRNDQDSWRHGGSGVRLGRSSFSWQRVRLLGIRGPCFPDFGIFVGGCRDRLVRCRTTVGLRFFPDLPPWELPPWRG